VLAFVKVLRGVLVLGAVATAHVATFQAQSQVHPGVSHFQTLFAPLWGFWLYRPYLIEMSAFRRHDFLLDKNETESRGFILFIAAILHPSRARVVCG
jgi:hypothetical protein